MKIFLASTLMTRLTLDGATAEKLAVDIAGYRLLPLDKWLGDISGYIRSHGGDPAAYPAERVKMIERTRDEAATEVVHDERWLAVDGPGPSFPAEAET